MRKRISSGVVYIHTQTEANGGGGGGIRWIFPAAADHLLIFQVPFFKPTMTMTTGEITLSVTIRYRLLLPCYFILLHPQIAKEKKKGEKERKVVSQFFDERNQQVGASAALRVLLL